MKTFNLVIEFFKTPLWFDSSYLEEQMPKVSNRYASLLSLWYDLFASKTTSSALPNICPAPQAKEEKLNSGRVSNDHLNYKNMVNSSNSNKFRFQITEC